MFLLCTASTVLDLIIWTPKINYNLGCPAIIRIGEKLFGWISKIIRALQVTKITSSSSCSTMDAFVEKEKTLPKNEHQGYIPQPDSRRYDWRRQSNQSTSYNLMLVLFVHARITRVITRRITRASKPASWPASKQADGFETGRVANRAVTYQQYVCSLCLCVRVTRMENYCFAVLSDRIRAKYII